MSTLRFTLISTASALAFAATMASGCGDDAPPGGVTPDGSVTDSPNPTPDHDNTQDTGTDTGTDAGPMKFSDYVKDLVNNQTSDTRVPDTRVNDTFVEDEDQTAYPASFFPP